MFVVQIPVFITQISGTLSITKPKKVYNATYQKLEAMPLHHIHVAFPQSFKTLEHYSRHYASQAKLKFIVAKRKRLKLDITTVCSPYVVIYMKKYVGISRKASTYFKA